MRSAEWLIYIIIFSFFMFMIPDIINYGQAYIKANQVADYVVERMAIEGGWSDDLEKEYKKRMENLGLEPDKWKMEHNHENLTEKITRSNPEGVKFKLWTFFRFSAFNILGSDIADKMQLVYPVAVSKEKMSQLQVRE
ncbi:DUF4320 family protein [Caldalkalibacillus mannanilyticus]|uniref:DUF4320 family protein n=1 Tax=Caldalkalibacillus mannanilyticus TaxID=1418 RepID=UPI000469FEB5|nr:DUF4320 family protein [Caldalkalibacillus mannanilyticus]